MPEQQREYVVLVKRKGMRPKRTIYQTERGARRRYALIASSTPWELLSERPDEPWCCSGYQCGCGGVTVKQRERDLRAAIEEENPLESVAILERETGPWRRIAGQEGRSMQPDLGAEPGPEDLRVRELPR